MNCEKVVICTKCGKLCGLVGTSQTADGKVFCEYHCNECGEDILLESLENVIKGNILRMKHKVWNINNKINRNKISSMEAVRLLGLVVYQILEYLGEEK